MANKTPAHVTWLLAVTCLAAACAGGGSSRATAEGPALETLTGSPNRTSGWR
ncbi:MAG: hypothetical protein ACE5IK_14785 [Acidobacteriota bacterium]